MLLTFFLHVLPVSIFIFILSFYNNQVFKCVCTFPYYLQKKKKKKEQINET